jgi:hypothetical protein
VGRGHDAIHHVNWGLVAGHGDFRHNHDGELLKGNMIR